MAESIDRLVIIACREYRDVVTREGFNHSDIRAIKILIFVDDQKF